MNARYFLFGMLGMLGVLFVQLPAKGQQIPQFSQYTFNALHVNPAYAGYKVDPFVQATYRSQFVNFPGAPKTFTLTADMGNAEESMGYGLSIGSDQLGPNSVHSLLLTYAYKIRLNRSSFLGLGVSSGLSEYVLDAGKLLPDDPSDPGIPQGRINAFTPNLNAGLLYHSPRFFSGISAFNLLGQEPLRNKDLALATHNYHFYFQVGGLLPLSAGVTLKPALLVREDLNGPGSFDLNAMFLFNERFWLGTSFRSGFGKNAIPESSNFATRRAIALLMDLFITEDIRFGYAYDFNLNSQNNYRDNSHEFSIGYYIQSKWLKSPEPRYF
ncbi:type IX secretion system membrane protein PorP/SprF [Cyclobacterium xiamenense]|uniref:PorP/SprF family type IX secretion system membrane protein n=1 Tax=Cyclobacterium xiamenense TaxID=1297121 RepID=UPI0035D02CFF